MNLLLDTCVVREIQKPNANAFVAEFISSRHPEHLFLSVITLGQHQKGISLLPAGQKRRDLEIWSVLLQGDYAKRILPIDGEVALLWGELAARDRNLPVPDGLIAATALRHGMGVVTRNTKDFRSTGVVLINPWQGAD
ncbi:MAG: type II toxin-antitoxin system VapC family toxin [Chloroflexia bacterium]|nr:type II toxin-antitoxin system VapC family toxin [Chloroflexia bacterium]